MIRIKGIDYKVTLYDLPKQLEAFLDHERLELGKIDYLKGEITLLQGINSQLQEETILHEIIHALTRDEHFIEEEHVSRISEGLYAVLKDNDLIKNGWLEKLIDEREMGKRLDDRDSVRPVDTTTTESLAG